jgi:aldehyde dehydrogenase (NAD+)
MVHAPELRAISFTGSNAVGGDLYVKAAKRGAKVTCEMGGKNAVIVMADADLDQAAVAIHGGAFGSTGQRCTATSRAIVEAAVADRFVALLRERAVRVRAGNGLAADVDMGPSIDEAQLAKVLQYMDVARGEGATVACGGARLTEGDLAHGYFPAPTIFDHVAPRARVAQEEIFGPALSVIRVKDLDEALEVANGVRFGLTSSIYTNDVSRWYRFAEEIETGITHLNSPTMGGEPHLPFGGMKATGVGLREMGRAALEFFSEVKAVYADYTGRKREVSIY